MTPTPPCGNRQTLIHVLNTCPIALQARRFNHRHDALLWQIVYTISSHLQPTAQLTSDLSDYLFPHHIIPTTRGGMIARRNWCLIELTVCFETSFNDARERKMVRYEELHQQAPKKGYCTTLITLEVGSRGIINNSPKRTTSSKHNKCDHAEGHMLDDHC